MKKNVLLVEDDPALRMVMREVLKDEFHVDEADNGIDGIDKGLTALNDLIILDYHLPKKDGLQVIEAIKQANPNVPVIVLTGFLNPQSEAKFAQLGAARIFPKPFNYRALLEVVRSLTLSQVDPAEQPSSPDLAPTAPSPSEREMLGDSLNAIAELAEKVEFLHTLTEKCWIEPSDIGAIRETARCMEATVQAFYGKMNNTLFNAGSFSSPLLSQVKRPCLSGSN